MDSSTFVAESKDFLLTSVGGSVAVALIAWFFELRAFFELSTCMFVMISIPPLIQWIMCDGPPLEKRGEMMAYAIPCLCFMLTYALPGIMASTANRAVHIAVYIGAMVIWNLFRFWLFHAAFLSALYFYPALGRRLYRESVELLAIVIDCTVTGVTRSCEMALNQYEKMLRAQERLVEARKPDGIFMYEDMIDEQNEELATGATPEPRIRLLKLYRRNPFSEITCRLKEFQLHKAPRYEAISYRWDDGKDRKEIIVNNLRLSLPRRAYDVLRGRSSLLRSRWIWIDAICIDQDDKEDKTRQVRLMGDIYQNASRTVIWLESAGLSRYEIRTTLNLLNMVSFAKIGLWMSFDRLRRDYTEKHRPGMGSDRWRGMNNLLRHDWFGRVWMVQEVVVAKEVHAVYGGAYLDWDHFSGAMSALSSSELTPVIWGAGETSTIGQTGAPLAITHTGTMNALRQRYFQGHAVTLKDGLLACSRFEASLAMDKVYSLQGFITEEIDQRLKADYVRESYTKNSVENLYTETAEYLLDQDYVADILPLAGIGHARKLSSLPSWVVDWSNIIEMVHFTGGSNNYTYRASGHTTSSIHLTTSRGRVALRGFKIDGISELGPKLMHDSKYEEKPSEHIETIQNIFRFNREAEALSKSSRLYNTREDSFWRAITGDRLWVGETQSREPLRDECAAWYRSMRVSCKIAETPAFDLILRSGNPWAQISDTERILLNYQAALHLMPLGLTTDDVVKNLSEAYKLSPSIGVACANRMFCITKRGYMAIVPPLTKKDDIVFIPLGAQAPFIIRYCHGAKIDNKTGKTGSIYKLVGECYVHGIMEGEAMDDHPEVEDLLFE